MENRKSEKLLWVDILKGLLILSVVIGHATGKYNRYMMKAGTYHWLFPEDQGYIGARSMIKELILRGNNYVWWIGTYWYLPVLFGVLCYLFIGEVARKHSIVDTIARWGTKRCCLFALVLLAVFGYLEKNSLTILIFHFLWFKAGNAIMVLYRVIPLEQINSLLPPKPGAENFRLLYTLIACFGSVLLWKMLCRFGVMRVFLGQDKGFCEKTIRDTVCVKRQIEQYLHKVLVGWGKE